MSMPSPELSKDLVRIAQEDMALQDMLRSEALGPCDAIDDEFERLLVRVRTELPRHRRLRTDLELLRYRVSKHLVELSTYQVRLSLLEQENARLRRGHCRVRT